MIDDDHDIQSNNQKLMIKIIKMKKKNHNFNCNNIIITINKL